MIRKKSNIFSVDQDINWKKNGQGATRLDSVVCPFLIIIRLIS